MISNISVAKISGKIVIKDIKSHNNKEGYTTVRLCKLIQQTILTKFTVPKAFQMKTEFVIYKGEIKFLQNQIKIRDNIFKWQKIMSTAYSAIYIAAGVYLVIRHFEADQNWSLFVGLAIIAIGIIILITGSKVNMDNVLDAGQIEKAVISEDFMSYLNLTLYLKNSQKRKIQLDYRDEDRFEKFHLNELIETMKSLSIGTEVK
jgi:H+/gluconate symporter-like permease